MMMHLDCSGGTWDTLGVGERIDLSRVLTRAGSVDVQDEEDISEEMLFVPLQVEEEEEEEEEEVQACPCPVLHVCATVISFVPSTIHPPLTTLAPSLQTSATVSHERVEVPKWPIKRLSEAGDGWLLPAGGGRTSCGGSGG